MRILPVSTVLVIAGMLPAMAQQTLPRPPSQMPPPGAQQKGPPPPQQQQQQPVAAPAPYTALKVTPPKPYNDPGLAAFRKELIAVAQKKDRPAKAGRSFSEPVLAKLTRR